MTKTSIAKVVLRSVRKNLAANTQPMTTNEGDRSTTFTHSVCELPVFGVVSRATMLHPTQLADWQEKGPEWKEKHRNAVASAVASASRQTGNEYRVEVVESFTKFNNFYIIVLITRIK